MLETILKYASVYVASMFKFLLGPLTGMASQLTFWESAIFSMLGMMTTVFIILILGKFSQQWISKKLGVDKKMARQSERMKRMWDRYGVPGIAFLTPPLLTPIGGAILAISFESSRRKILKYMFVSAVFWAFAFSFIVDRLGSAIFGF